MIKKHNWKLGEKLQTNLRKTENRQRFICEQEDARRRLCGMCWCKKELPVCSMAMESWVVYATNVCRRDGDVLLRNNTQEDGLHARVPLLLKTKLTSTLPPYMLRVWGSSLKFAFLTNVLKKCTSTHSTIGLQGCTLGKISGGPSGSPSILAGVPGPPSWSPKLINQWAY